MIKAIDPTTANNWLNNNEAVIIDVREPREYDTIHIKGAKLIPLGTFETDQLPTDLGNKKLIIHCHLGMRSSMACEKLSHIDPEVEVYNLEGGISAWEQAGFDVEKPTD